MAVFCSTLISCFPGTLFTYFLNDFQMVPVALLVTFVFTFHISSISTISTLYVKNLPSFLITFLSTGIAISMNMHVILSQIVKSS